MLEERFASPKLDSFSQRLSARCYLEALNRTETENYIQSQINAAGGCGEQVFSAETCQSVFQATGGVPRLVNQVCDHALLLAYVAGRQRIEPSSIEEAWGDLQQLPTPSGGESKDDRPSGVIEFGSLDDQADTAPSTATQPSATVPALWITSAEEDREGDQSEPVQQIHRIERLLAEADDDFQPAGSIGPEVELCFDDAAHPFQEQFEHEEVVADRYASAAVTAATPLPTRKKRRLAPSRPAQTPRNWHPARRLLPSRSLPSNISRHPMNRLLPLLRGGTGLGTRWRRRRGARLRSARGAAGAKAAWCGRPRRLRPVRRCGGASTDSCSPDSSEGKAMGLMRDALKQIDVKTPPAPVILPLVPREQPKRAERGGMGDRGRGTKHANGEKQATNHEERRSRHPAYGVRNSAFFRGPWFRRSRHSLPVPRPSQAVRVPRIVHAARTIAWAGIASGVVARVQRPANRGGLFADGRRHPSPVVLRSSQGSGVYQSGRWRRQDQLADRLGAAVGQAHRWQHPGGRCQLAPAESGGAAQQDDGPTGRGIGFDLSDESAAAELPGGGAAAATIPMPGWTLDRGIAEGWSLVLLDMASLTHAEVAPLARHCDGVYLVVRLGHTARRAVTEAASVIRGAGGRLLGCAVVG